MSCILSIMTYMIDNGTREICTPPMLGPSTLGPLSTSAPKIFKSSCIIMSLLFISHHHHIPSPIISSPCIIKYHMIMFHAIVYKDYAYNVVKVQCNERAAITAILALPLSSSSNKICPSLSNANSALSYTSSLELGYLAQVSQSLAT